MVRHPPVISLSCTQTQFVPQGAQTVSLPPSMTLPPAGSGTMGGAGAQELGVAPSVFQAPQGALLLQYLHPPLQRHAESSCKEWTYVQVFLSITPAAGTRPGKSP